MTALECFLVKLSDGTSRIDVFSSARETNNALDLRDLPAFPYMIKFGKFKFIFRSKDPK